MTVPTLQRLPLALKLLIITELLLLVAVIAMLVPVRYQMRDQAIEDLQSELRGIAVTTALQILPEDLLAIRQPPDTAKLAFNRTQNTLIRIRDANGLTQDNIYTLYSDGDSVRFGVMTHQKPFIGERLAWHEYWRPAFEEGKVVTSPLYSDKFGQWISAFAPVVDPTSGQVAGVVEVNKKAEAYFDRTRKVAWITASIAAAALALGSILGFLIVNHVVLKPMSAVRGGMLALMRQDFTHRVRLSSRDEFGDLAALLNDLSRQLNAAKMVADGFTPKSLPSPPGWALSATAEPCEATAGDYFDAFDLPPLPDGSPGGTAVLVADVTGHGLGPSLHMSACRSALRALASTGLPPDELLHRLDLLLQQDLDQGRFITLFYGVLHPDGSLSYCNAGHGPALLRVGGVVRSLAPHRPPLGIGWDPLPGEDTLTTVALAPGDRLLVCTDGVSEAMNPAGDQLGTEPLERLLCEPDLLPATLAQRLKAMVNQHCGGRSRTDDVTILCVQRSAT
jgi:hypothetical protein